MNEEEVATCHCIIGHPHKAKFLAINHQTGWSVPTLKFTPGPTEFRAGMITQGMQHKYGLNTRVLRPLVSTPRYHCLELEVLKGSGNKNLNAVWVDREQYQKARNESNFSPDPFKQWLQEKEQGKVPASRPAWQIPGWFDQADHWIHFQAEKLGLQVTGSVQQYKTGWNASCLLYVPTSEGRLFFKAAYAKPPGEAALTVVLANKWPNFIVQPLVVDCERNWLLNRDWSQGSKVFPDASGLPEVAGAMATLQIGSMDCMDEWRALGCPVRDLDYLLKWMERKDALRPFLLEGPDQFNESEIKKFGLALDAHGDICRQLHEFGIPAALIHKDFRQANMVAHDGGVGVIDWSDVVIGHPFLVLEYFNSKRAKFHSGNTVVLPEDKFGEAIAQQINTSYLKGFLAFAPMERLEQAWALTRSLFPVWHVYAVQDEISWAEKNSPRYSVLAKQLKLNARKIIGIAEGSSQQDG